MEQSKTFNSPYLSAKLVAGIIEVQYKDGVYITLEEAKHIVEERLAFFGDNSYPFLLKSSKLKGMDRAARKYFFGEGLANIKAMAFVPGNKVGKMITTVLITFERPKIPYKVFKTHDEARDWLRIYLQ